MTEPDTNTDPNTATSKRRVVPTKRCLRVERPERIAIGDDTMVRNDILAAELGCNVRTLNRGDKDGAPFILIGGVKYRPLRAYHKFLSGRIKRLNQPPQRRGHR
jgi:hypothetical protein